MVAVPGRGLGLFFWACPQLAPIPAGGRSPAEPRHAAQRSQYLSDTTSLLLPRDPNLPAWAPNTRRATCGATAVPRGMSQPSDDFTGLAGTAERGQAGVVDAERRRLREGEESAHAKPAWRRGGGRPLPHHSRGAKPNICSSPRGCAELK